MVHIKQKMHLSAQNWWIMEYETKLLTIKI